MLTKLSIKYVLKNAKRSGILLVCIISILSFLISGVLIQKNYKYNELLMEKSLYSGYDCEFKEEPSEFIKKIEGSKFVQKVIKSPTFGMVNSDNGVTFELNGYEKEKMNINRFKLVEGRLPKRQDEIIIEKRALDQIIAGKAKLGTKIDVSRIIEDNSDSKANVNINNSTYTVVGIIDRSKEYYKSSYSLQAYTHSNIDSKMYNGFILFKKGVDRNKGYGEMLSLLGKYDGSIRLNNKLQTAESEYNDSNSISAYRDIKLLLAVVSLFMVNIFFIFAKLFGKEITELRIIGASRLQASKFIFTQFAIISILGCILGSVLGISISYFAINQFVFNTFEQSQFIVEQKDILQPILITVFIILLSSLIPMKICCSPLNIKEGLNIFDNKNIKKNVTDKKIDVRWKLVFNSIFGSPISFFITVVSFIVLSVAFFQATFRLSNDFNVIDMQQNNLFVNDIVVSRNIIDTNPAISYMNEGDMEKISKYGDHRDLTFKIEIPYTYMDWGNDMLSKDYIAFKNNSKDGEKKVVFKAYSPNVYSDIEPFIEKGSISEFGTKKEYSPEDMEIPALISKYYYDTSIGENKNIFKEGIKIGDVFNTQVNIIENGKLTTQLLKIKIVGFLNEDWIFKGNSNFGYLPEVIVPYTYMKDIGIDDKYSSIGVIAKKGFEEDNISKIANEYDKQGFSVFSLDSYRSKNKSNDKVYVREKISKIAIMLILAFINMYLMVSSNILKKKEIFRILMMLGLEKKKKYSIVVLENLIVVSTILLLSSMIAIFIYYTESSTLNQLYMDIYSKELFTFRIPYLEMFIFALVTIISSMATTYFCKDMKEN